MNDTQSPLKVRMGVGLGAGHLVHDRRELGSFCRAVEENGFDSIWLSEVIASGAPDPMTALAFIAARTERLMLGTSVMVAPGRPPALLAKAMATLDLLSGGRFLPILGLGAVDSQEQQAFNVDRGERVAWMEESVPLIRRLLDEERVEHRGELFALHDVSVGLRPRRSLPIWFGGRSQRELVRTGRLADGWLASFATPEEVADGIATVSASAKRVGRSIDEDHYGVLLLYSLTPPTTEVLEFLAGRRPDLTPEQALPVGPDALHDRLGAYVAAGASKFVLVPARRPGDWDEEMSALSVPALSLQTPAAAR